MAISNIFNLDLLSVGLAVAGIGILGFIVFFSNRQSITNKTFLFLSLAIIFWSLSNYFWYQITVPTLSLWILRLVMFFAVWFAFFVMQLLFVFPKEKVQLSNLYKFILPLLALFISILTLTPMVFSRIAETSTTGQITKIINGPGIFLFGIAVMGFNLTGIILLVKKMLGVSGVEKKQFRIVLMGIFTTLSLIVIFNFILPAFFDNSRFIPLGAVFIFPFIAFTSYAILRHHLLNIKIIATEIMTFILAVVTLVEIVFASDLTTRVFRSGVFLLVLSFGILLIKSVRREVEQRERLEILTKELTVANSKLKELDRAKSEFLSFASHQVRAPMAVVKGYASLILDGSLGAASDKIKNIAAKIKASADKMILLVSNLLDARKIEEGKMEYNFEETDLVPTIKDIVSEMNVIAKDKNLELSFSCALPEVKVKIDVQRFSQVIQNLVDNALKYTEAGCVKVVVEKKGNDIIISVSDTGRGISAELKTKLFEEFYRGDAARKEIQGTGFGLYIAKQIVLAHHGEIWVESEGEGKGSVFYVKIPAVS